ncbi:MAG: lysophospholipid acyltransferase family protein [bacterium]
MASLFSEGKFVAEYAAYAAFKAFLRLFSYHFMLKGANRIGEWIFYYIGIRRHVALANLRYAFGDQYQGRTVESISRKMYGHFSKMAMEMANMDRIMKRIDQYVQIRHIDRFKDALRGGKGAILATGHFGNFEIGALAMAMAGLPITLTIKPLRNPFLDRQLKDFRRTLGTEMVNVNESSRPILSALKRNRVVCLLGDQDVGQFRGTTVDFFGHPTSAPIGTARMALHTGAPILPTFIFREESGIHVVEVEHPLDVDYAKHRREKEIQRITQTLTTDLERWVRRYPEQYFWVHRRWKSNPDGEWLYSEKR